VSWSPTATAPDGLELVDGLATRAGSARPERQAAEVLREAGGDDARRLHERRDRVDGPSSKNCTSSIPTAS
jgi:hypothetical protein